MKKIELVNYYFLHFRSSGGLYCKVEVMDNKMQECSISIESINLLLTFFTKPIQL